MASNWFQAWRRGKKKPFRKSSRSGLAARLEMSILENRDCASVSTFSIGTDSEITGPGDGAGFLAGEHVHFDVTVDSDDEQELDENEDESVTIESSGGFFETVNVFDSGSFDYTIKHTGETFSISTSDGDETGTIDMQVDSPELKFISSPTQGVPGGILDPTVVGVYDDQGRLDTEFDGDVTISLGENFSGATLSGTLTVPAIDGVATFDDLSIDLAGQFYSLIATLDDGTQASSDFFDVGHTIVFDTQPSDVAVGADINPPVVINVDYPDGTTLDSNFNGDVQLMIDPNGDPSGGAASLSGSQIVTGTAIDGVVTFDGVNNPALSIDVPGQGYALQATLPSEPDVPPVTSASFDVGDHIRFQQQPTDAGTNQTIMPPVTVEAYLADGTPDTNPGNSIVLSIYTNGAVNGDGVLEGTLTEPVDPGTGIATFDDLSIDTSGRGYTLLATLQTNPVDSATDISDPFNIGNSLRFSTEPQTSLANFVMPPVTVDVLGPNGELNLDYNGEVDLAIDPNTFPAGTNPTLSGGTVDAVNGVATFTSLSIDTPGTYDLIATTPDGAQATSTTFNILALVPDHLAFVVQPTNTVLGQKIKPYTVDVLRPNNTVDTSVSGRIAISLFNDASTNHNAHLLGPTGIAANNTVIATVVHGVATIGGTGIDQLGNGYTLAASSNGVLVPAVSKPFNITPPASAPVIVQNPSSQMVPTGGTAIFTAEATSTPAPTAQWQASTNGFKTFTTLAGGVATTVSGNTTTTTLSVPNLTNAMNGEQFRVVFANGKLITTSSVATLTVLHAPTVTTSPASVVISAGGTASFTAVGTGGPIPTVTWKESTDGGKSYTAISGAGVKVSTATSGTVVTSTLTLSAVPSSQDGALIVAVFANPLGTASTTPAGLTVRFAPTVVTQPASQSSVIGGQVSFTAAAHGDPAVQGVQWEVKLPGSTTFSPVAGGNVATSPIKGGLSSTLTITGLTTASNSAQYKAVFTAGTASVSSNAAVLLVGAPVVTTNPRDTTVTAGTTAKFSAAATGNPTPAVQWQVSSNGGKSFANIPNATGTTYSFVASAREAGYLYRAVFHNAAGTAATTAATLQVNSTPSVISQPLSQSISAGNGVTFSALGAGFPNPTVQWFESTDGGKTFNMVTGATSDVYDFSSQLTDAGHTYYFYALFTNSVGSTKSSTASLKIM
jgi:hypothetical protein